LKQVVQVMALEKGLVLDWDLPILAEQPLFLEVWQRVPRPLPFQLQLVLVVRPVWEVVWVSRV